MSLARRITTVLYFTIRCSYCGAVSHAADATSVEAAAVEFRFRGWMPHPRDITLALCCRCGTLYPDFVAIDRDIDDEIPF